MLVSNTSTLVLLAKVDLLEIFIAASPVIEIPEQVQSEAIFEPESYYARLIIRLIGQKKIVVQKVRSQKLRQVMKDFRLHEGEAAAFVLFDRNKHKTILTDDGELIKLCKLEGISFICALAVVLRLFEKKIINKSDALEKMDKLITYGRYSKGIIDYYKSEVK